MKLFSVSCGSAVGSVRQDLNPPSPHYILAAGFICSDITYSMNMIIII